GRQQQCVGPRPVQGDRFFLNWGNMPATIIPDSLRRRSHRISSTKISHIALLNSLILWCLRLIAWCSLFRLRLWLTHRFRPKTFRRLFRELHGQLNTTTFDDVLIHSASPPSKAASIAARRDSRPLTSAISCECVAGVNVDGFPVTSPHATGDESPAPGDHGSPSSSTKTTWPRN